MILSTTQRQLTRAKKWDCTNIFTRTYRRHIMWSSIVQIHVRSNKFSQYNCQKLGSRRFRWYYRSPIVTIHVTCYNRSESNNQRPTTTMMMMMITMQGQKSRVCHNTLCTATVRENVCNNSKKRKKSCFLDFEKNVKNVKKTYIQFHRPFNHSTFNTQLPKVSTGNSGL